MVTTNQILLIERIQRIARESGNTDLFIKLDRIMDRKSEPERIAQLGAVVKELTPKKSESSA